MRTAVLAIVLTAAGWAQGVSPQARIFLGGNRTGGSAGSMARIPPFVFGSVSPLSRGVGSRSGVLGVPGVYGTSLNGTSIFGGVNGYLLNPGFGGLNGYYYWTPPSQTSALPVGPSYANPGVVRPVGELPPALQAPDRPGANEEWLDARSSFNAASAKVSSARLAVEELRARLEALGQSPRATLISQTASAEAALKSAQEQMTAGKLDESVREIQRANYIAGQVLKEFGR